MRVLVTNDDGIESPGLSVLVDAALARGHTVVVAAPSREYSGASASLHGAGADGRLRVGRRTPPGVPDDLACFAVGAAPALISYAAASGAFGEPPDILLSGVNRGQNTGHLILHSGTAGAALAAALHGIRAIAVSIASPAPRHWMTAGAVLRPVLVWAEQHARADRALNLNVPDLPIGQVRGLRRARLAQLGAVQAKVETTDGHLRLSFSDVETFAGTDVPTDDHGDHSTQSDAPETDATLLAHGWATVTQLRAPADDRGAALPGWLGPPA